MNIYVGNLAREMGEDAIRQIFAAFGEVEKVTIIKDKYTGDSRGFGFVEMPNKDQALAAITGLNGKDHQGRTLNVNEARPRNENRKRFGSNRFSTGNRFSRDSNERLSMHKTGRRDNFGRRERNNRYNNGNRW